MSDECDPILVTGDDGEILDESTESGVRCEQCGQRFERGAAGGTFDGTAAFYRCPACGEWVEGPPPG